ncbi:MAG: carotenoid oxygenase family protein [Myxacorys chilensis ATA2-1-KO14]|jgi:carotenoid cleavage dioxygenase-like enzyme|nr:carotenoid oxygenase family protein [Myxacorys chilensis ATA2-1-KO14]
MVIATRPKDWVGSVLHTANGFAPTALAVLSGTIPTGLRGSLYRNGPARLERGNTRVSHWFDGDGAVLGVHFTDAGATGVYRYVQGKEFQEEEQAGHFLYGGYGMLPPGGIWNRFTKGTKNAGNTSVLAFDDRVLALWEGGHPYALNPETLDTEGQTDLNGLPPLMPFSAHPKRDDRTGEVYNFGVSFGKNAMLNLYRLDAMGNLKQRNQVPLDGLPLIHDFVMAGQYLLFFVSPVRLNPLPVLSRLKGFGESFEWKPEKGTQILVIDRNSLEVVSRGETEPWYQWHFGNGAVDRDGHAVVDVVRYEDFNTNQLLKEVATGHATTKASSSLWQIRLDPKSGTVFGMDRMLNRDCEFPVVKQADVGQSWRYTYLSVYRPGHESPGVFGAIARFDQQTGDLMQANLGEDRYAMEPIYAPDAQNLDQGWIVTVVYDGNTDTSEVWVFDSDRLDDEPVCRLALPEVIPLGFHGTWKPA